MPSDSYLWIPRDGSEAFVTRSTPAFGEAMHFRGLVYRIESPVTAEISEMVADARAHGEGIAWTEVPTRARA